MRADSSLRDPRSSLINEDAAIMKVISPRAICHRGEAIRPLPVRCFPAASCRTCSGAFAETRVQRNLEGAFAALVIADANRLIHPGQKNLPVADLARARCSQ